MSNIHSQTKYFVNNIITKKILFDIIYNLNKLSKIETTLYKMFKCDIRVNLDKTIVIGKSRWSPVFKRTVYDTMYLKRTIK